MGATNLTTYYNLSQFIGTDKPAWLQDYNGDMLKIDTGINGAKIAADAAALAASTAQGTADANSGSISTLNTTVSTHTNQISALSGAVNTINSLIGNGTPTTTDQTIIGAINELNGERRQLRGTVNNTGSDTRNTLLNSVYALLTGSIDIENLLLVVTFTSGDKIIYRDALKKGGDYSLSASYYDASPGLIAFESLLLDASNSASYYTNISMNTVADASSDTTFAQIEIYY